MFCIHNHFKIIRCSNSCHVENLSLLLHIRKYLLYILVRVNKLCCCLTFNVTVIKYSWRNVYLIKKKKKKVAEVIVDNKQTITEVKYTNAVLLNMWVVTLEPSGTPPLAVAASFSGEIIKVSVTPPTHLKLTVTAESSWLFECLRETRNKVIHLEMW